MLFKIAITLLVVWLLGMFGVYRVGDLAHIFLLVGLMLLLLAVLKARGLRCGVPNPGTTTDPRCVLPIGASLDRSPRDTDDGGRPGSALVEAAPYP